MSVPKPRNARAVAWGLQIKTFRQFHRQEDGTPWSQEYLGKKIGVSGATVSRWESGMLIPRDDHRDEIAAALNVPYEAIFRRIPA